MARHPVHQFGDRHRAGHAVALDLVAAEGRESLGGRRVLDAFSHHGKTTPVR